MNRILVVALGASTISTLAVSFVALKQKQELNSLYFKSLEYLNWFWDRVDEDIIEEFQEKLEIDDLFSEIVGKDI